MFIEKFLEKIHPDSRIHTSGNEIIPLGQSDYDTLHKKSLRQTQLTSGQSTKPHTHSKTSFYLAKNLAVKLCGKIIKLPQLALVIVQPHAPHPWLCLAGTGEVSDIPGYFRHHKHVFEGS